MIVPLVGTSRIFKSCVFLPRYYCSDTLLGIKKPAGFDFQSLYENVQLWWLTLYVLKLWKYSSHVRKNLVTWVFFIFLPALLVRKCTKIIELIKFIFIFGTYQDFPKSCFSVLQKSFLIHHDFFERFLKSCCKYLNSK